MTKLFYRIGFNVLVLTAIGLFTPATAFSQTEKLGIVTFTPPKGMNRLPKENVVTFSEMDQATGRFCIRQGASQED